ncbi:hypothetical protein DPMN_085680 [Dreissena polymorpha]|uniref:Uncharacterized protein n=1 Tax=Dreissena polymorpha TaxID=45954 RepID=A0A9D3YFH6_DREPO|nr:hypothetical protein DPMN_085680 [Dreissena polymorpha]
MTEKSLPTLTTGRTSTYAKIMQDPFANAGDNKQGKWQKLSNGNYFKADTPTVLNYHNVQVSSSSSNPERSNIDVNNILKNALGNAGNTGNAQNWQKLFKADTPSVHNYRYVEVSNRNADFGTRGSNVEVNKILQDAFANVGNGKTKQNTLSVTLSK